MFGPIFLDAGGTFFPPRGIASISNEVVRFEKCGVTVLKFASKGVFQCL